MKVPLRKIYYGWWILAGAVLAQFTATSTGMVSGVLLDPLVEELDIKVWQFAAAVSLATALGATAIVVIGPLVDRVGPRRLMLAGAMLCAFGLVGLSLQTTLLLFFIFQVLSRALGVNLFSGLVINATLTKWFIARRGWALAVGSAGVSLGGIITPITMTGVVDHFGWRFGYLALAGSVLAIIIPVAFVMRRQPEDMGLLPDGVHRGGESGIAGERTRAALATDDRQTHTRRQAVATPGFWLLTLGYGLNAAALGTVILYAIPFATSVGFARSVAAVGLGINGVGNLTAKAVWGWGLQRFDARRLAGAAFSSSALGVLLMVLAGTTHNTVILMIGFFLYGFGFGGTIPIGEFLWARYFGRRHIGAIRGVGRPITLVFSTSGPIATGAFFDFTGSYVGAFLILTMMYLLGAIVVNLSKVPRPVTLPST